MPSRTQADSIAAHAPGLAERPECRSDLIQSLVDGVDRYNPDNVTVFEDYLAQQCQDGTYDCLANLALLKLYQFNPHLFKDEQCTNALVKSLAAFPQPDFSLHLHLLPPHVLVFTSTDSLSEAVQKLQALNAALSSASYAKFWEIYNSDDLYADLVADCAGFEAAIRRGVARTTAQASRVVSKSVLGSWTNLKGDELENWAKEVCGWTVEGEEVKIPVNKDNEAKPTVAMENIKLEQLQRLIRHSAEM
ncbi:putative eukaryotic translation initiation factor 3 subunit EifCk [Saitoella complicata NRRL Y-17804]|uniref:putative eukaryotic translation initiation factor 3 subunit EifCk n=1 Tax=Saitoella complicata (strain BCRC 22490 / CBS 7301 / JCM 7358 / NBRC 10748 / NRRL Y-17804) TaxID=698492 RepID=UPI000867421A|nr:putative eukaryotic translation initiation factor 3 subunit EifCk [Saitoella complicata NRRL Y-17804]ODQ56389.1 putative eukaryotic translation initiation factor 3 subunit EifCk [Saitoella complicata NRRL Y-17804]